MPPQLTDEQIDDLLEGTADMETQQHKDQCPYCAHRVEMAEAIETQLHARLYRWNCPSSAKLRDFAFELLNPEENTVVEKHVKHCIRCREDLKQLDDFLDLNEEDLPVELPVPSQTQDPPPLRPHAIVAAFVSEPAQAYRGAATTRTPVLRGTASEMLTFVAGPDKVYMQLTPSSNGSNLLTGRLFTADRDHWTDAIVEMWRERTLECTTIIDDKGKFRCQVHESGVVQVRIIAEDGRNIVINDILIEP